MQSSWGDFSCVDQQLLELSLAQQHNRQQQTPQPAGDAATATACEGTRRVPSIDCGVGPLNTVPLPQMSCECPGSHVTAHIIGHTQVLLEHVF